MTSVAELPAWPLTLDDVTRLAEADSSHRFELIEGNLVVMPPGTWRHQKISGLMFAWFSAHGYGDRVNIAPGVRTADDNLSGRIPDLVVTTDAMDDEDETVWLPPETVALAVEIVSKGSERTDRWHKPVEYAAAGIARYWRVEPDGTVLRFRLDGAHYVEESPIALDDLLAGDVPDLT